MADRWDNIYLDTTLAMNMYIRRALERVGAGKLVMAAEHSSNIPVALEKINCIDADEEQKRKILGGNAIDLYDLDVAKQNWEQVDAAPADD